ARLPLQRGAERARWAPGNRLRVVRGARTPPLRRRVARRQARRRAGERPARGPGAGARDAAAAAPGANGRARAGEPSQGRIHGDDEPRAAHAAQCHWRLCAAARGRGVWTGESRAGSGDRPHHARPAPPALADLPLGEIVGELAVMIEPQMAAKGLVYRVELPEDMPIVRADREKLVQVLLNLLSNAIKFTESGGGITLRVVVDPSRAVTARIEVADTGRGIPVDRVEAVFEPFVQVRSAQSRGGEGTGLGLAISRKLARGMGGDLTATSELGKGSTFIVTLPRIDAA